MVQSCVVVGCTNRWQKGSSVSWHRIPCENNPERRKKWLAAINRKNWNPTCQDRVCGKHFLSGSASHIAKDPDYAPSLYLGYSAHQSSTPKLKLERFARSKARQSLQLEQELDENDRQSAASISMDLSASMNCQHIDADNELTPPRGSLVSDTTWNEIQQMKLEKQALMKELGRLQKETDTLKKEVKDRTFGFGYLSEGDSNKRTSFYTGIPNFRTFMWLVSFLHSSLPAFTSV